MLPYCDVTPEEAKRVYESLVSRGRRSSNYAIAAAFVAAGRKVTARTIRNWRVHGWTKDEMHGIPATLGEQAVETLDLVAPLITGNPEARLEDVFPNVSAAAMDKPVFDIVAFTEGINDKLATMSDAELITEGARSAQKMNIVVAEVIARQADELVKVSPRDLGALLRGHALSCMSVNSSYSQATALRERALKLERPTPPATLGSPHIPMVPADDPLFLELQAFGHEAAKY